MMQVWVLAWCLGQDADVSHTHVLAAGWAGDVVAEAQHRNTQSCFVLVHCEGTCCFAADISQLAIASTAVDDRCLP